MSEQVTQETKRSRARNGKGTTYRYRNGWRTAIQHQGQLVTATGVSKTESQRRAQAKLKAIRHLNYGVNRGERDLELGVFLSYWIEHVHKYNIAFSSYKCYRRLIRHHIDPLIGHIRLVKLEKNTHKRDGSCHAAVGSERSILSVRPSCAECCAWLCSRG